MASPPRTSQRFVRSMHLQDKLTQRRRVAEGRGRIACQRERLGDRGNRNAERGNRARSAGIDGWSFGRAKTLSWGRERRAPSSPLFHVEHRARAHRVGFPGSEGDRFAVPRVGSAEGPDTGGKTSNTVSRGDLLQSTPPQATWLWGLPSGTSGGWQPRLGLGAGIQKSVCRRFGHMIL